MNIFNLYKKVGETPLECLRSFQEKMKLDGPMTYLGRLDPMAEGVLLVSQSSITPEERNRLLLNDKTYQFKILLGLQTDTYDCLGIARALPFDDALLQKIPDILQSLCGRQTQEYPPYSSKPFKGKPMFVHARANLPVEDVPTKEIEIKSLKIIEYGKINNAELQRKICEKIGRVNGDFRQDIIQKQWQKILGEDREYHIIFCEARVSSGTYIRSIANKVGLLLDSGGVALEIIRTRIGDYNIKDSII